MFSSIVELKREAAGTGLKLWESKHTDPIRKHDGSRPGLTFEEITTSSLISRFWSRNRRISGRNNQGEITIWRRGGGHKRHYRIIDFKRDKTGIPARVATMEYDPNRSAFIALLHYADGEKRYILYPQGLEGGRPGGFRTGSGHRGRATRCR